ncbi:MAG: peptidoglycan editing factor PgeF [Campylobacterota bacterium]|nr:peptidoglycan editing factor PgeF [Campylobacterota bacterium]
MYFVHYRDSINSLFSYNYFMKITKSKLLRNCKNISHAFTSKECGISKSPYNSLNLAFHVGDDSYDVEKNHQLLADTLSYEKQNLIYMKQIHSSLVHVVDESDNFSNPKNCDALITNKKNTPLMVMVADCSPILFYDSACDVIAVAHAGREGAFKNIVQNVIDSMKHNFNSKTKNILVTIGASIGSCCYEVGEEIFNEAKRLNLQYALNKKKDSYYLNISRILKTQLLEQGIKKENLEISKECSCCKNEKYFSYRANGTTGRFCGVIYLT